MAKPRHALMRHLDLVPRGILARHHLSEKQHRERHCELHRAFEELLVDFVMHTSASTGKATVNDLRIWSSQQTQKADEL